jgi:hypothetical protein
MTTNKTISVLMLAMLGLFFGVVRHVESADFITCQELVTYCESDNIFDQMECYGYVVGATDSYKKQVNKYKIKTRICEPKDVTVDQESVVFIKWASVYPEELQKEGAYCVITSLMAEFTCK